VKALRFENQSLQVSEIDRPKRSGEALVRVTMAGVCSTDLEIVRGYAGFSGVLGHEFVGVVEDSPDRSQIGRRVVGEINTGCGRCEGCRRGDPRHCPARAVLGIRGRDGAFAEYLTLPPENLRFPADTVTDRQAIFTEPLAAACQILDQVTVVPTTRAAVIGDGKLGQLVARTLQTTGAEITMIGKHATKLALAAKAGVQTLAFPFQTNDKPSNFDLVVEASGSAGGLQLATEIARPQGTIILKSTFAGEASLNTSRIVVNELKILGSRCGRFEPALALLAQGKIEVESLIAHEFPLSDGVAAIQKAATPGALKVLIVC
jgi:threonine dehydrogenase-like Zn-dependent dehydrogenase